MPAALVSRMQLLQLVALPALVQACGQLEDQVWKPEEQEMVHFCGRHVLFELHYFQIMSTEGYLRPQVGACSDAPTMFALCLAIVPLLCSI